MTAYLRAALKLAARGLAVFPCQPRDKRPATLHGLKDATTDPDMIQRWWSQEPSYNIGVATGAASGILAVDVDGIDAEAELRRLEIENSALPFTVESITARGRHLLFRWPGRDVRNSASKIAPGIDVRGNGGFIVVPPSLHPTGKRYAWSVDSAGAFADAPEWLLDRIASPIEDPTPTPPAAWCALIRDGASEGIRNDSLARLAGHLLRRLDAGIALELMLAVNDRCKPPLSAAEVVGICDSIAQRELKRRGLAA